VLGLAKQAGIAIYTIALKSAYPVIALTTQKYFSESEFAMKALAQETGARAFFPTDIAQLAGVYSMITDELVQPVRHRLHVEQPEAGRLPSAASSFASTNRMSAPGRAPDIRSPRHS
jgi:hypothetical protein